MPRFLLLGIHLLLLFGDSKGAGWNHFLHGGSIEAEGDNYDITILTGTMTGRLLFSDGDIKAEMVLPPWNNFLWSLLCFVVVRSRHDE